MPQDPAVLVDNRTVTPAMELDDSTGVSDIGSSVSHNSRASNGNVDPSILPQLQTDEMAVLI